MGISNHGSPSLLLRLVRTCCWEPSPEQQDAERERFPVAASNKDAMEVCSLHHAESQGYEMRLGGLLDTLPEYKNLRKPLSPSQGQSLSVGTTPLDMKRTHSEMNGNLKKGPPTSITSCSMASITAKITQKLKAHAHNPSSSTQITKKETSGFQSQCNNNSSSKSTDCKIFLGGSCNPTSWRKDIAIPILNHSGISFFNPQVASWCPELMAAEHEAKDLANFLFFVIDSETRAIASLVEVAYLIAQGKNVILVIAGLPLPGNIICGEPITESEIQDLASAQHLLRQLSIRNNIRVFECIRTAVQTTAILVRQNEAEEESPKFENGCTLSIDQLPCSIASNSLRSDSDATEFLPKRGNTHFDIFLGGTSITDEALGHLKKHGLSSWTQDSSDRSSSTLLDDSRIDDTKILFFYLGGCNRSLETLILAAYYVGQNRNIVLCIENLGDGCIVNGEVQSQSAVKDYNRGRSYLRDVAERHGVQICVTITSAIDTIVTKLNQL